MYNKPKRIRKWGNAWYRNFFACSRGEACRLWNEGNDVEADLLLVLHKLDHVVVVDQVVGNLVSRFFENL